MRLALAALLGVHLLLFGAFYFGPPVLLSRDLPFHHYPLKSLAAGQWAGGHPPFWDDRGNCGQPLLANPSASALYPPMMAPLALFPGLKAFTVVLAAHHLWLLLGAFCLARALTGDPWRALVPALAFGLSGPVLGALPFANPYLGMAWLPWALWGLLRFLRGGRGAWLVLAGGGFALAVLAGFDFAPLVFPASFAALALAEGRGWKGLAAAGGAVALGLLLAAIQVVPTAAYLPHARRADPLPYEIRTGFFSFHPLRVSELAVPGLLGWRDGATGVVAGSRLADRATGLFQMPYLGIAALLLALSGAGLRRRDRWWWGLGAAGLLCAFGRFLPLHRLLHALPGLGAFRFPEKYLLLLPVALLFLTARAFDREPAVRPIVAWVGAALLGLVLAGCLLPGGGPPSSFLRSATDGDLAAPNQAAAPGVAAAFAAALAMAIVSGRGRPPGTRALLLAGIVAADLLLAPHPGLAPSDPGWAALSPLAGRLRAEQCTRLVVWGRDAGSPGGAGTDLVPGEAVQGKLRTLHPLSGVPQGVAYAFTDLLDEMDPRILPRALTAGDLRAFGVSHALVEGSGTGPVLGAVARHDFPGGSLFRLGGPATPYWFRPDGGGDDRPLLPEAVRPSPAVIRLTVRADGAGTLRVGESGVPGWRAWVGGAPRPLERGGFPGLSVRLEGGVSEVQFAYRPPGWRAGLLLSFAGLLGAAIIGLWKPRPTSG
jgi:hypothetical protein